MRIRQLDRLVMCAGAVGAFVRPATTFSQKAEREVVITLVLVSHAASRRALRLLDYATVLTCRATRLGTYTGTVPKVGHGQRSPLRPARLDIRRHPLPSVVPPCHADPCKTWPFLFHTPKPSPRPSQQYRAPVVAHSFLFHYLLGREDQDLRSPTVNLPFYNHPLGSDFCSLTLFRTCQPGQPPSRERLR